ncbi:hypothetical protein E5288_WYG001197 [Bos mutus]|uniref:Uncharacterized protein n=1 Tax=Bos mutus TaxID=72004 RepID=A0A6B0RXM7_9CETA|nr:hypothetical protein [Bos mutus]
MPLRSGRAPERKPWSAPSLSPSMGWTGLGSSSKPGLSELPMVTVTQECGVLPRPPPRLSVVLSVVLRRAQRMLSAREEA